jgi:glutamine synthetase
MVPDGTTMVRIDGTTLDGPTVGKFLSPTRFEACLPEGVCLADFALAADLAGTPQLGWWGDWRQPALGDMYLRPDPSTGVADPDASHITCYLGSFTALDGTPLPVCPRSVLHAQIERLARLGYQARAAFELEFFLVDESIGRARQQGFTGLTPLGGPGHKLPYVTQRGPEFLPILRSTAWRLERLGIPWEAFNEEAAPGQFELNLAPADPLTAADWTVRAKGALRAAAYEHGRAVTFMARPFPSYGSGLHLHLSLWRDGSPCFDAGGDALGHWVGGSLATAAGALSVCAPTINSFRRQVDFAAAPTTPTWGEDNRGVAVRTISRPGGSARVEHRMAAADANPYLVAAVVLAGGLAGLEQRIDPPAPSTNLPWGLPDGHDRLPASITAAAEALAADERLRKGLGDGFVDHWVESRRWEWLMYHSEGDDPDPAEVTDWERRRYFEWV